MNLARLLLDRAARSPEARFGTTDAPMRSRDAVDRASRLAELLDAEGIAPGHRVALVGATSADYLVAWAGLQLAGVEAALINPNYPGPMLAELVDDLDPVATIVVEPAADWAALGGRVLDVTGVADGSVVVDGVTTSLTPGMWERAPGRDRPSDAIAGYMHTSGTTGPPKFCAQSQRYFVELGAAVAAALELRNDDVVLAPLPMFHINPLGYGVGAALSSGAGLLGRRRFSASEFWNDVRRFDVTALVLHGPPLEILKRGDAVRNGVRTMFWADLDFMERFDVPLAVSAYGSTEAAGISNLQQWTVAAARAAGPIDLSRVGGESRDGLEWTLDEGEILVREREPGVGTMFSGYLRDGSVEPALGADGWFRTGDLGATCPQGLRFVERRAESIRVKGEYVPIPMLEERYRELPGVEDLALWKRPGALGDDELVLFTAPALPDSEALSAVAADLPGFMRPSSLVAVAEIPRDDGVGKVRRRLLDSLERLDEVEL